MNSKMLMTASSLILGITGIVLIFMPAEISGFLNLEISKSYTFFIQIIGALYFSFAALNWMSKSSIIGGIYNRPIVVANFTHFFIVALTLTKELLSNPRLPYVIWIYGVIYLVLAIAFGVILIRHPLVEKKTE